MNTLQQSVTRRLLKATVRHSVRGAVAKAKRKPIRSTSLLGTGLVVGATIGWLAGRASA
jgi:F0F1-type ATP synthase assembly protein I